MNNEERKVIENSINDLLKAKDDFSLFVANYVNQTTLSHLDFLKSLAGIIIAFLSIAYLLDIVGINKFSILSFSFSIFSIIFISSYIKEYIDDAEARLIRAEKTFEGESKNGIDKAVEALEKNDASIYFNYAREQVQKKKPDLELSYVGEVVLFLFYNSLFFTIVLFLIGKLHLNYLDNNWTILIVLALSFILSFLKWSLKPTQWLSIAILYFKNKKQLKK
ncbi:MAG TPA: hypothetical protein P5096_00785 [Patescibacteria group bacterium]|nr:hypothetical protein [Patescibacteria group bacterium]